MATVLFAKVFDAIGARVLVRYGGKVRAQSVLSLSSYLSANDRRLQFGLGAPVTSAAIKVHWPRDLPQRD